MPNAATSNPPMTETIESANAAASTVFIGHNSEFWDFWLIVSFILVALAAIAAGVTGIGSIVSHSREASAAEDALKRFKLTTEAKISVSNARTKEAELKLAEVREKLGRPRKFNEATFLAGLVGISPVRIGLSLSVPTDPDSDWLSFSILGAFERAKWSIWTPPASLWPVGETPSELRLCAGNIGKVAVLSRSITKEESSFVMSGALKPNPPKTPFIGVWRALWNAIGENEVVFATCPFVPEGELHIVVPPRWAILPEDAPPSAPEATTTPQ